MVNCRILPGHSAEEVRKAIKTALNDEAIKVTYVREFDGKEFDVAPDAVALPARTPNREVMSSVEQLAKQFWPGVPVILGMSVGESDGVWTASAGMPTYMTSGLLVDSNDVRVHGKDERLRVSSFEQGTRYFYQFVKTVSR
jgi:acetylornithine deacetylase/succinyl-diaminopimelate desuccinylase-like protein